MAMHEGEVGHGVGLVGRLVAGRFPGLADRPVRAFGSTGTVNAIYRVGDDLCVRLPLLEEWSESLERELEWLPRLAPHLPLRIPEPVGRGEPGEGFPLPWAVYRWIEGRAYEPERDDEVRAAQDLARFVLALRAIDTAGAPPTGRRPLRELEGTREALEAAQKEIDTPAALTAWDRALDAPPWNGEPVWIHNDLLPPNLLVDDQHGHLTAVLDFGTAGVGDPAADVVPAWSVFGPAGREAYRTALAVDDATWDRARGYALHQAALIVPYYRLTNPGFVTMAVRTVGQVVSDSEG
jgi:aminoglycoside phosphotransferase (APT) family kinase protein